jgi:hypothetical protein
MFGEISNGNVSLTWEVSWDQYVSFKIIKSFKTYHKYLRRYIGSTSIIIGAHSIEKASMRIS